MKNINFNDQELDHMISSYSIELSYAEDEVAHIKQILKKISSAKKAKDKVALPLAKKKDRKPKATVIEKAEALLIVKPEPKAAKPAVPKNKKAKKSYGKKGLVLANLVKALPKK